MSILQALFSVLIAQLAGVIGSFFTFSSVQTWYTTLITPPWNPPSWIFGPVWTILYTLMGIAAYLVWRNRSTPLAKTALIVYGIQLVLNALWSILFFGLQNPAIALLEIVLLLLCILTTLVLFWRISPVAGALLIPYVTWVSFATYLNFTLWQLN